MELSTIIEKGATIVFSAGTSVASAYFSLKARIDKLDGDFSHHKEGLADLEKTVEKLKEDLRRYQEASNLAATGFASDDEFTHFVEESQSQWQQVQRTLGHIEGTLTVLRMMK